MDTVSGCCFALPREVQKDSFPVKLYLRAASTGSALSVAAGHACQATEFGFGPLLVGRAQKAQARYVQFHFSETSPELIL